MLDESYFNGERLRRYLELLKEFGAEPKEQAYVDVKEPVAEVVAVDYCSYGDPQDSEADVISMSVEDDTCLLDVTVSSVFNAVVTCCTTVGHVNKEVKDWSKYLVKDFKRPMIVKISNGRWSKELKCEKIGIICTVKECRYLRNQIDGLLHLVQYDYSWIRTQIEKVFLCTGVKYRYVNRISYFDFDRFPRDDYVYVNYPFSVVHSRCFVGSKNGVFVVMNDTEISYKHTRMVRCQDFLGECFLLNGVCYLLDLISRNGKLIIGDFDVRKKIMHAVVSDVNRYGERLMSEVDVNNYNTVVPNTAYNDNVLFFRRRTSYINTDLFMAQNKKRFRIVFLVRKEKGKLPALYYDNGGRLIPVQDGSEDLIKYENYKVLCECYLGSWHVIKIVNYSRPIAERSDLLVAEGGITVREIFGSR